MFQAAGRNQIPTNPKSMSIDIEGTTLLILKWK